MFNRNQEAILHSMRQTKETKAARQKEMERDEEICTWKVRMWWDHMQVGMWWEMGDQ